MADFSGENTLIKIAIFCITVSMISTVMFTFLLGGSPDYDYDTISDYRSDLVEFSGGKLVNDNPWVLKGVYTPFTPGLIEDSDIPNHIEDDNGQSIGWLYGEKITTYPYLDKSAGIKLDPNQKSNQLLTVGDQVDYSYRNGLAWWAGGNDMGMVILDPDIVKGIAVRLQMIGIDTGVDENTGYTIESGRANNWNYTGYRYVFDPVLPFGSDTSSKDGRLSIVWYQIPNDSGLSGALEVYGTSKSNNQVKLGTISAAEIIQAFRATSGYVQVFDFDFEGTHLNLTIKFDPTVYNNYNTLQDAWDAGAWSLAISSASAGNFFDVETSNAFDSTAGSVLDTFIKIYTFDYPHFEKDPWAEVLMWLLVGLPMTLGLLFVTLRLVGGVFKIF